MPILGCGVYSRVGILWFGAYKRVRENFRGPFKISWTESPNSQIVKELLKWNWEKRCHNPSLSMSKVYYFPLKVYERGTFFIQNGIWKGKVWDLGLVSSPPPPPPTPPQLYRVHPLEWSGSAKEPANPYSGWIHPFHYAPINVNPEGGGGGAGPRAYVGHLTSIAFPTLGNLTKNLDPRVGTFAFLHGGMGPRHIVPRACLCTGNLGNEVALRDGCF